MDRKECEGTGGTPPNSGRVVRHLKEISSQIKANRWKRAYKKSKPLQYRLHQQIPKIPQNRLHSILWAIWGTSDLEPSLPDGIAEAAGRKNVIESLLHLLHFL